MVWRKLQGSSRVTGIVQCDVENHMDMFQCIEETENTKVQDMKEKEVLLINAQVNYK